MEGREVKTNFDCWEYLLAFIVAVLVPGVAWVMKS